MVVEAIFDSVCRCLGASPIPSHHTHNGSVGGSNNRAANDGHASSSAAAAQADLKRRTERLQLHDKQLSSLFDDPQTRRATEHHQQQHQNQSAQHTPQHHSSQSTSAHQQQQQEQHHRHHQPNGSGSSHQDSPELEQARAVAKAKLQAQQQQHQRGTKRKSQPTDIFRTKKQASAHNASSSSSSNNPTMSLSRFLSNNPVMANALCFATPIHDSASDSNDEHTLNTTTAEDETVTSTLCFERKYAHMVEHQPPMPLFDQFRVGGQNELRQIVATDSHNSLKMIHLLHDYQQTQGSSTDYQNNRGTTALEDSEDDADHQRYAPSVSRNNSAPNVVDVPVRIPREQTIMVKTRQNQGKAMDGTINKTAKSKKITDAYHRSSNDDDDSVPPPVKVMTDSSSSSASSRSFDRRR